MTRIVALLTAFVAVLFGVLIPATAASAQPHAYPPTICPTVAVSTTTPLEGQSITVSGVNFAPHTKLTLELHTQTYDLGTVTTDAQGTFTTTVKLPAGVSGSHLIVAVGGNITSCPADPSAHLDIQGTGQPSGTSTSSQGAGVGGGSGHGGNGGGTAFTGVDILLLVLIAAGLLGAGVALVRSGKRRKQVEWYAS